MIWGRVTPGTFLSSDMMLLSPLPLDSFHSSPLSSRAPLDPLAPQGPPSARPQELLSSLQSPPLRPPVLLMPPWSSQPLAPPPWPPAHLNPLPSLQPRSWPPRSRLRALPPLQPNPGLASPTPLAPPTLLVRDPPILPAPPALPNCLPESPARLALLRLPLSTQAPPAHSLRPLLKPPVPQAPQRDQMTPQCPHSPPRVLISALLPLPGTRGSGALQRACCSPRPRGRAWGSWGVR